jgi:putative inorganic carbon (hco3(-)) transporter
MPRSGVNPSASSAWWRPRAEAPAATGTSRAAEQAAPAAFWATVAFTVILVVSPQTWLPVLGTLRIALLAAAVALVAWVVDRATRGRPMSILPAEMALAGALLGWSVLTIPLSIWPGGSVQLLVGLYAKTLVLFWMLANIVTTPRRLRIVAWTLVATAALPALTGIRNYLSGAFVYGASRIAGFEAPLTGNPNDLALFLNMVLPFAIALFLGARSAPVRWALLAVIALDVVAIIATFSRAGFLTLVVVGVASAARLLPRAGAGAVAGVALVLVLALASLPEGYGARIGTILDSDADHTQSAQTRWDDSVTGARLMLERPLVGVGLGMSMLALNEARGAQWSELHNVYLQYGVDLGLPGLVLFLLLVVGAIRAARVAERRATRAGAGEFARLAAAIEISLVSFAVAALFYPVAYHFYFYYLAALAIAARAMSADVAPAAPRAVR